MHMPRPHCQSPSCLIVFLSGVPKLGPTHLVEMLYDGPKEEKNLVCVSTRRVESGTYTYTHTKVREFSKETLPEVRIYTHLYLHTYLTCSGTVCPHRVVRRGLPYPTHLLELA